LPTIPFGLPRTHKVHGARRLHWLCFVKQQPSVGLHAQLRAIGGLASAESALIFSVLPFAKPHAYAAAVFVYEFHPSAL